MLAPYLAQVAPGFDLKLAFLREALRVWTAGLDTHTLWQPFVSTASGFGLIMSHPKEKVSFFFSGRKRNKAIYSKSSHGGALPNLPSLRHVRVDTA